MAYILTLPSSPSFEGKGLKGFQFAPLTHPDIDVHLVDVEKGHDTFMISKKITRIYYVLEGQGYFTIDNNKYDVRPAVLVQIPPNVEYSYSGQMKLLLIGNPRWFKGNEVVTKKNPDVFGGISLRRFLATFRNHRIRHREGVPCSRF